MGMHQQPPREGAGLSCCKLLFETAPILAMGGGLLWWVWGACWLPWAQHKLVPTLPTFEGSSLKLRRWSRSLVAGTAWYCAKRKVKTVNNPPSANHRLMGGTGFVELLCTGQGGIQLCSVPGSLWLCWCS